MPINQQNHPVTFSINEIARGVAMDYDEVSYMAQVQTSKPCHCVLHACTDNDGCIVVGGAGRNATGWEAMIRSIVKLMDTARQLKRRIHTVLIGHRSLFLDYANADLMRLVEQKGGPEKFQEWVMQEQEKHSANLFSIGKHPPVLNECFGLCVMGARENGDSVFLDVDVREVIRIAEKPKHTEDTPILQSHLQRGKSRIIVPPPPELDLPSRPTYEIKPREPYAITREDMIANPLYQALCYVVRSPHAKEQ